MLKKNRIFDQIKVNKFLTIKMFVYAFLVAFFLIIDLESLSKRAVYYSSPKFLFQYPAVLILVALVQCFIIYLIYKISKKLYHLNEIKVVGAILLIYSVAQLVCTYVSPIDQEYDQAAVFNRAIQISHGDFSSFKIGHYLSYYPNNIGITLIYAVLFCIIPAKVILVRFVNVVFTTLTTFIIYKIYKEFISLKNSYFVLLVTVLFTPVFLMNNRTYNDVISTTFCILSVYLAMKFTKTKKNKFIIFTSLALMIGNFIRATTLLFLVGILLYWFINGMVEIFRNNSVENNTLGNLPKKNLIKKTLAGILLSIIIFNIPMQILSYLGLKLKIIDDPIGAHGNPVLRWVNIGFPHDEQLGYWDKGKNIAIFLIKFKSDPKKASEYFKADIKNKFKKAGVLKTAQGYIDKTLWQWSIGTYITIDYYGHYKFIPSQFILQMYLFIVQTYNWLIYLLIIFYLVNSIRKKDFSLDVFFYVILIYIGFYLIWEIKPSYLYGLYPCFLIIASKSAVLLIDKFRLTNNANI